MAEIMNMPTSIKDDIRALIQQLKELAEKYDNEKISASLCRSCMFCACIVSEPSILNYSSTAMIVQSNTLEEAKAYIDRYSKTVATDKRYACKFVGDVPQRVVACGFYKSSKSETTTIARSKAIEDAKAYSKRYFYKSSKSEIERG